MGEVFRARDTRLGRDVAVKVLPDHLADDPKALHRFESEAKAVAALSHPNILFLLDVGETNGIHYAVTELLEGEPLRALVARGPVPVKRALEIAHHVADALAAAHEKGIVHRDVKPENVFLTQGRPRQAPRLRPGPPRDGPPRRRRHAHPDRLRPHRGRRRHGHRRLHVTGAGARAAGGPPDRPVLPRRHALRDARGKRPFRGRDGASLISAILRDEPEPLDGRRLPTPVPVRLVVERCLAKEPRERYASTRDLARDLASWREHASGSPSGSSRRLRLAPAALSPRRTVRRRTTPPSLRPSAAGALSCRTGRRPALRERSDCS